MGTLLEARPSTDLPSLHEIYETLPDFHDAVDLFTKDVVGLIWGPICQLFLDHGKYPTYHVPCQASDIF